MVENQFYRIYEFSTNQKKGLGSGGFNARNSHPQQLIPPAIAEAIRSGQLAIKAGTASDTPAVLGRLVKGTDEQNQDRLWAALAVVTLAYDEMGRPLRASRYFWCDCGPDDPFGLAAILTYFQRQQKIPVYDPDDQDHQHPEQARVDQSDATKSLGHRAANEFTSLLVAVDQYPEAGSALEELIHFNQDVIFTVNCKRLDFENIAWAWNVGGLEIEKPEAFFVIKPVNPEAYAKIKAALPIPITDAPPVPTTPALAPGTDPPPPLEVAQPPLPGVGSISSSSVAAAVKKIADIQQYPPAQQQRHKTEFHASLTTFDRGLGLGNDKMLIQAFRDTGCSSDFWQNQSLTGRQVTLLLLQALAFPHTDTGSLRRWLAEGAPSQRPAAFQRFHQAIYGAFCGFPTAEEPTGEFEPKFEAMTYPHLYANLLETVRQLFGEVFQAWWTNSDAQRTSRLQKTFAWFMEQELWQWYFQLALADLKPRLNDPNFDPRGNPHPSGSEGWRNFETSLHQQIQTYIQAYDAYVFQGQYRDWFQQNLDQISHHWPPHWKRQGYCCNWQGFWKLLGVTLDPDWAALFSHLDQGNSQQPNWPAEQLVLGNLPFIPRDVQRGQYLNPPRVQTNPVPQGGGTDSSGTTGTQPNPPGNASEAPEHKPFGLIQNVENSIRTLVTWGYIPPPALAPGPPAREGTGTSSQPGGVRPRRKQKEANKRPTWKMLLLGGGSVSVVLAVLITLAWSNKTWPFRKIDPNLGQEVLKQINLIAGFKNEAERATVTAAGASSGDSIGDIEPSELAKYLSEEISKDSPLVVADSTNKSIETKNTEALSQAIADYEQKMGLPSNTDNYSDTAYSWLCQALDKPKPAAEGETQSEDSKPPYLFEAVDECDARRMFIDRQMKIDPKRFWFGEIVTWTSQSISEHTGQSKRAVNKSITNYLKSQNSDKKLRFGRDYNTIKPLRQRQLLALFYPYISQHDLSGTNPLDFSQSLLSFDKSVEEMGTAKTFRCNVATYMELSDNSFCSQNGGGTTPPTTTETPSPSPTPTPSTNPADYGNAPQDVREFVEWFQQQYPDYTEAEVFDAVRGSLRVVDQPESTWQNYKKEDWEYFIAQFQTTRNLTLKDGVITSGGETQDALKLRVEKELSLRESE